MASSATCCSGGSRCGPGRPMAIGRIAIRSAGRRRRSLFGLPGNPVAVMVTFYAFVRDALLAMSGATPQPLPCCARAQRRRDPQEAGPHRVPARRRRARARRRAGRCAITGAQGSGILRSMSEANGLVVLRPRAGQRRGRRRGRRVVVRRAGLTSGRTLTRGARWLGLGIEALEAAVADEVAVRRRGRTASCRAARPARGPSA